MEIAYLGDDSIKIKEKKNNIIVDHNTVSLSLGNDALLIEGPGEYEAEGVKISALGTRGKLCFNFRMDQLKVFLADKDSLDKNQFEDSKYDLIILSVNTAPKDLSVLSGLSSYIVLHGRNALDQAKLLGREDQTVLDKLQIKEAPEKTEIAVIG